ncbi:ATP-dependent helicase [Thermophagus xiamenensis]|uniref:DNA replication ATP-dependent helicase Dna2 n=1 Tax=Thermophagus xiamenensis TaxID=385682 RepID=A0A1I2A4M6_9BACT|nr:AAA domain-containing protein [Thermophagus xiamenensis]SFE37720.1 DNA replication ATP-dependent helicase Dna2 [Thermophagus xiamenensis]
MTDVARRFFDELIAIDENDALALNEKIQRLRASLEQCCRLLSREDGITFSNFFGRLNYVCNKMSVGEARKKRLHAFRIFSNKVIKEHYRPGKKEYLRELKVVAEAYGYFFSTEVPVDVRKLFEGKEIAETEKKKYHINREGFRGILLQKNEAKKELLVQPDGGDASPIVVLYDVQDQNRELTPSVELMQPGQQLQLLQTHRNEDGTVVPGLIVLEPDYLVDVTAIARCFQNIRGKKIRAFELYFVDRFEPRRLNKAIHKGNVANMFFDELVNEQPNEKKDYDKVLKASFLTFPLPYTSLSDIDKAYFEELKEQYANIRRVVDEEFVKGDYRPVSRTKSNLEVSLMSPELGLQGRMDLFDESPSQNHHYLAKIIELKSGSLRFSYNNPSAVAEDHSAQVRMYNMMAQRVLGYPPQKIFNAVLYSSSSEWGQALRYVEHFKSIEREIINVRNQIVAWEYRMASDKSPYHFFESFFQSLDAGKYGLNPGDRKFSWFTSKFLDTKKVILEQISDLERQYYFAFSSFISREKILSKVGDGEYSKGLSALWNKTDLTDEDRFNELRHLKIKINHANRPEASITLSRPDDKKSRFVNFRRGDICVLYPHNSERLLATQHRVMKCTIQQITNEEVTVRLRQKQSSLEYFQTYEYWGLEHDSLDNNFEQMQSGLHEFLKLPSNRRALLLGLREPRSFNLPEKEFVAPSENHFLEASRREQNRVLSAAWNAGDYFLLVGPPGTGKTNLFLQRLVKELVQCTALNILLVSYTNRAVDEMCSSVRGIVNDEIIRIGSSLGCDPKHEDLLLDRKIKGVETRLQIRRLIEKTRLYVGTLSSVLGKQELFELKKFDIAIVDEASQILEPNILPLLSRVDRFVLIGDERQLPAVVAQSPNESKVDDVHLHEIGLFDRRNSYFERLLWICRKNGWHHAWGELTFQGRMHPELAQFSNRFFYGNKLKPAGLPHQKEPLISDYSDGGPFSQWLQRHRMIFIPSAFFIREIPEKHNTVEAQVICRVLGELMKIHRLQSSQEVIDKVGIITPYRNQIAGIREEMEACGFDFFDAIQIDTVERYQGSQKDFILISLCMNSPSQLDFMAQSRVVFHESNGKEVKHVMVDRKLNVMLTRARKQIIITGNEAVLRYDEIYGQLIEFIREKGGYYKEGAAAILEN